MSNTERKPIFSCSGPVPSDNVRIIEGLDRDTDPFGVSRPPFQALSLLRLGFPYLREVRISKVEGNQPIDQAVPIDEDVRVLVPPNAYEELLSGGNPTRFCYFFLVGRYSPLPLLVGIKRFSSENHTDGSTFCIAGTVYTGDRPGALAYWAHRLRQDVVAPQPTVVEEDKGDEHKK
ncbi:hypothetical protein [Alternaria alternata polymycovirus 1]|nr:hypothetical protein [Alternaria alternata polymycovirus 1]